MCATCGCSDGAAVRIDPAEPAHGHSHSHGHGHGHEHEHGHGHGDSAPESRTVQLEQDILAKNDLLAEQNRRWLGEREIVAVNLMSSPGAGKTTLLERTVRALGREVPIAVVEGDQETALDAERIRATGTPAVQINTGAGCHLDAQMLQRGLAALEPEPEAVLFIENVGNLVCPALFDLGESARVVIISVTEGPDKPLKYPHMVASCDLILLNKVDLLPYLDLDTATFERDARRVNPGVEVLPVSATRGDGMAAWYGWLRERRAALTRPHILSEQPGARIQRPPLPDRG